MSQGVFSKASILDLYGQPATITNPPANTARLYYNSTLNTLVVVDSTGTSIIPSGGGAVSSVFGRTGAVVATSGDYSFSLVSGTVSLAQGGTAVDNTARTANTVFAGPTSGGAGSASFRALVAADMPAGTGTVTSVAQSFTGGLISVGGSPITASGTLALTVAGTSGGIPYFSGASTWASSSALTSTAVVLGGGAGNAPNVSSLVYVQPTLTISSSGNGNAVLALSGNTSGTATFTAPAIAGTATNPISISNSVQLPSGTVYQWNADTGLSRDAAGVIDIGNGTAADVSGSIKLSAITMTGILSNSKAGALSAASVSITGAPVTGGTGTTTFPLVYLNSGVTAPIGWSTAGTCIGINAPSGYTGNYIDFRTNGGATIFTVASSGAITATGTLSSGSGVSLGAGAFTTSVGVINKYNNVSTVSGGVPAEYATVDLTAQGAAITATTLYAVPAGGQGMYRISWSATITTVDGAASVLGGANGFQIIYTSPTDSVVKTTVTGNSITSAANTTGTAVGGVEIVYAKLSTNIQYQYDYTSTTPGQMKYELHIKLEAL